MASDRPPDDTPETEPSVHLDAGSIERIARRVAELLRAEASAPLEPWLTAAEVAERYSVSRAWVYDNAGSLGAIRLGAGTKARLRFDPNRVQEHFSERDRSPDAAPERREGRRRWVPEADLIPIRGH